MSPTLQSFAQQRVLRPAAFALTMLIVATYPSPAAVAESLDDATNNLIVTAVVAAFELDLYNSRCRSDQSGRRTENLNKELISRFRMTVIDAQDDLFPEAYYRDAQARMQADFLDQLREMGGCQGAKAANLRDTLQIRYQELMDQLATQP